MKRLFAWMMVVLLAALGSAQAQRLDDDYVQIFNLIQDADALSSAQPSQALIKYREAQTGLERLQRGSPDWNPTVVAFRLRYVAGKIAQISPQAPVAPPPAPKEGQTPSTAAPDDLQLQMNNAKEQIRQLEGDKAVLEAKLKESLAMQPAAADPRELARAEEKIKALQKENELLKVTVENGKAKPVAPASSALDDAGRVKQLERERDALQKQLQEANKEIAERKVKPGTRKVKDLENQVTDLRARLETLEAPKVPYSAEELALFKAPDTQLSPPEAKPARNREFPAGSAALITQAQTYFAAQQFDKAEATYRQVLQLDQKNVPALANLAAIQVEAKHFDDADSSLKAAMAVDPDDPYSLYVLGLLKFRQAKYDEAVDALSRSAKIDGQKAEVQNYLGLALSEKGLRGPAETALRKAIELQPNYAGAHYNLALFYVAQQPKYPALARWHYQKALSAGFPRNADLEKMFGEAK